MKFATKVVIFLSSSFAFVKGDDVCMSGYCFDPATTTDLNFSPNFLGNNFIGSIPTEIGLLSQLTYIRFCTCFGVVRSFLVPLSLALPLTFG